MENTQCAFFPADSIESLSLSLSLPTSIHILYVYITCPIPMRDHEEEEKPADEPAKITVEEDPQ